MRGASRSMGDTSRTLDNLLLPEALEQPRPRLSVGLMEGEGYVPLDIRRATSSRSALAPCRLVRSRGLPELAEQSRNRNYSRRRGDEPRQRRGELCSWTGGAHGAQLT